MWLKPWPVTSSLYSLFQAMEETWLPVSRLCSWVMLAVFQTLEASTGTEVGPAAYLMVRSTVPPAVARTPACQGHHDTAFTADWWAVIVCRGESPPCREGRD